MALDTSTARSDIAKIYIAAFNRAPDAGGLDFWTKAYMGGTSLSKIAEGFASSQEFTNKLTPNAVTNSEYVAKIYLNVFGRTVDSAGSAFWTAALDSGKVTKAGLLNELVAAASANGSNDGQMLANKATVGVAYATSSVGSSMTQEAAIASVTADSATVTTALAAIAAVTNTVTLTTAADAGGTFNGTTGDDTFVGTETTLSSSDILDGSTGTDTLRVANSGAAKTFSGIEIQNIETVQVTADGTGASTFDLTGTAGVTKLVNSSSSQNLIFNNVGTIPSVGVALNGVTAGSTTVTFTASAVSGSTDSLNVSLNGAINTADNTAIGTLTVNGIETLAITTTGANSSLTEIASTSLKAMTVAGDKNLSLANVNFQNTAAVNTLDASTFTGALTAYITNSTATLDVKVTGGSGNDTVRFNAFDTSDEFNGGTGTDTIGLTQAVATALTTTTAGTLSAVETLEIYDAGTGSIDMDNFSGITTVYYSAGLGAATTVADAVTGLTTKVNVGTAAQNLTVALKTDGSTDTATLQLSKIGAADAIGTVTINDAETLAIVVEDDSSVTGTGVLTATSISATDATSITMNATATTTVAFGNVTTPILATFDASASTAGLTISGLDLKSTGATVTLGAGNDVFNVDTAAGADTFDLSKGGNDRIVYTALAQSGVEMDTIKGFVAGSDDIDLRTFATAIDSSSKFKGTKATFGEAQGALTGTAGAAVFDASSSILWVDTNTDGTLDSRDFRVKLEGVTSIAATDLMFQTAGNSISLTATAATVNTTTNTNASAIATNEDDTITATYAFLNGSTIDSAMGNDSLTISAEAAALTSMDAAGANTANIDNVENVTFDLVTGVMNLGTNIADGLKTLTLNGASAGLTATFQEANQSFTVNNTSSTNVATIAFANLAGLALTTGAAADVVTAVQTTDASISTGSGNDDITFSDADPASATVNAGTGTDVLKVTGTTTIVLGSGITGFEQLNLNDAGTTAQDVTLVDGFTSVMMGDATDVVRLTATQASALTTIDATTAGDGTLTLTSAGAVDLRNATISTTNDLAALAFNASGNTVTLAAGQATNGGGFATFTGGAGTDVLVLTGSETLGARVTAIETIQFTTSTAAQTLTTGTLANGATNQTITAAGSTVAVSIDATDWNNITAINAGTLTIIDGQGADTITATDTAADRNALTITLSTGGADTIVIANTVGAGTTNEVTINSFTTGSAAGADMIDFKMTNGATNHTSYQVVSAAATNEVATASIIEINSSVGTVSSFDAGAGGSVETLIASAIGSSASGTSGYIIYGSGASADKAALYEVVSTAAGGDTAVANITVELVGVFNNVTADSFVLGNFI